MHKHLAISCHRVFPFLSANGNDPARRNCQLQVSESCSNSAHRWIKLSKNVLFTLSHNQTHAFSPHRKNGRNWVCSCRNPLQWKLPFYRTEWKRHTSYSFFFFLRQLPMVSVWPKFRPKANIWEAKAKKRGRNRDLPQSHRSGTLTNAKSKPQRASRGSAIATKAN